ncbi:von Willebrand factor D and EGF domain-containing protein-like isoform X2 [Ischnura elegans]|uniref:von Willebrand factor D and EGF domain-containing protein-like isoform X2 n=1 Tax=Ischnura elegans TaxID=197161 RepID=UPI001ED8B6A9|nr:von Willebrand factor D and EGF domain-containing protein-like isoform X2 [Ischnura elegans]
MSAGRTTISLLLLSLVWGQKPPQTLMPPPMPPPQTTSSGIDPCLKENHAVILDEPRRSFNWALEEGSKALCDSHLAPGWYRFQSAAGSSIPTGCPPLDHCGTEYPIWHRGQIPTATEGIVNSIGCGHVGDDCCKVQLPILLKNCSTSVVYFLQPTPTCHMAYCAGYMVPCPRGLVSNTGFTPCQFEVELVGVKVVSNLNSEDHPQIHCIAFLEKVTALDTLLIEVDWLSGGAVIHQQQYHPADYSYAVLPHQFWKLGQTLQCRARVRHISINTYTPQVTSPPFYAGIQIISRAPIVVQEGGPDVFLELRSTVPVGCHDNNCCIPFKIGVQYPDDTHYCPSGEPLDRLGLKECTHHICKDDWNTTHKIALRSKPDNLYGGNQLLSLEMGSLAHGHSIWSHYKLPSQQVQVAGFDVSERCTSDSYISTFDGQIYSHSLKGSFLFYKNGNHEVEITYSNCTYRRNCNCAVTIRGDHSVIKADICMKGYLLVWSEATYAADEDGDHTHQDVTILQENEGRSYKAVFSSGTIVKLGPYLSYVTVYALRTDLGKTSGLCGLFDRNPSNDLVNENGTPACVYRPRAPCAQYSQRWKVPSGPAAANKTALAQVASMNKYESYCACRKPAKAERNKKVSEPRNENEVEEGEDDDEQHCHSSMCEYSPGIEMSEEYLKFAAEQFFSGLENKGLSQSMVVPNEMVPAMYPPSGWNAQTAGIACQRYISGSAAAGLCSNIAQTNLPDRVSECTSDIMVSNNTGWAAVSLNRFKSDCKAELYRNLSLWERTPGGQITTPLRILNSLCVNNCSQNGICKAGVCYCNKEYAGSDCSIQVSEAPVLLGLTSSPCDVYKSSCKFVAVNGREFFEHPHLMCLIEVFLVKDRDDSIMSQGFIKTEGEFLSYQIVICPLPNLDVHSTGKHFSKDSTRALLKVSVCYGLLCATPMDMWIYDSRCWDCTNLTCKPKLPGPCFYYNPYYTPQQ